MRDIEFNMFTCLVTPEWFQMVCSYFSLPVNMTLKTTVNIFNGSFLLATSKDMSFEKSDYLELLLSVYTIHAVLENKGFQFLKVDRNDLKNRINIKPLSQTSIIHASVVLILGSYCLKVSSKSWSGCRTRQIIRCRVTATLRWPHIWSTLFLKGFFKNQKGTSSMFDKFCSGSPEGRFGKLFLIRDADNFYSLYFK